MKDKVLIMGSHPAGRDFDFNRTDCDIWVFNEALKTPTNNGLFPRADAVFQLHDPIIWRNPNNRNDPTHYAWLKSGATPPIIMQKVYEDVPQSVALPRDEIVKSIFGNFNYNKGYITSSIAWAVFYAAYLGYKEIIIRGVELESRTEYEYQQQSFTMAVGYALGRGCKVDATAKMFDFPLYGFEGEVKLDRAVIEARMAELEPLLVPAKKETQRTAFMLQKILTDFVDTGTGWEKISMLLTEHLNVCGTAEKLNGAWQENKRYLDKADAMIKTSGDFIFSRQEFEGAMQGHQKNHAEFITQSSELAGQCTLLLNDAIGQGKNKVKRIRKMEKLKPLLNAFISKSLHAVMFAGMVEENIRYMNVLDKHIKAAGGAKSEAVMLGATGV